MIPVPRSEDDYRTELIKEINARLPHPYKAHNSKTITFDKNDPRVAVLKALKREFDIVILDEAFVSDREINPDRIEFAVETKPLGSTFTGISQAEDAFTAFSNLKITYATNFGNKLYKREKNNPEIHFKILSRTLVAKYIKIAEYISKDVKKSTRIIPSHIGVSEEMIIATLTDCMDRIHTQMTELPDENDIDIATRTLVMWKKYDDEDLDVATLEYNVKRAAAYIIVDQLMFYNLLQKKTTKYRLPPLEPINGNEDNPKMFSTKYIDRAISDTGDYLPIFGIDMFELLPKSKNVVKAINDVVLKINNLEIETQTSDFIGKIFHSMIPSEIRKSLAAYYTGNAPAKLLSLLSIRNETDKICDLACGSGTLLIESYHVLYDLYKSKYSDWSDEKIHKLIIETQIYGNDITLFASHLAAMNLASQYLDGEITKINISSTDGLQITPRHSYGTIMDFVKTTEVSIISMDGAVRSIAYPFVNCVIMNPPFSRQTDMTDAILKNLTKAIIQWFPNKNDRKKYIDKKMGLHGYFLIHADHLIKKNGRIAMVLPSSTFTTEYSAKLLQYLQARQYSIEYVIEIRSKRSAFSEDATFKEYLVVFQKGTLKPNAQTILVSINDEFSLNDASQIYNIIKNKKKSDLLTLKSTKTQNLYESTKWTNLFLEDVEFSFLKSPKLEKFGENTSNLEFTYGFHGSYAEFLMLPNKEWSIEKVSSTMFKLIHHTLPDGDDQKECQIPLSYLVPAIRKSSDANFFTTSPNCYVLNLPYRLPRELDEFHRKYIYWAELQIEQKWEQARLKGHKRSPIIKKLTQKKNKKGEMVVDEIPWFSHAYKNKCATKVSHLFFIRPKYRPKTRRAIVIYSKEKTSSNDIFYQLSTKNDTFYASWTSSSLYLYSHFKYHQIQSKGLMKIERKDFGNVLFPKMDEFSKNEQETLIKVWQLLVSSSENLVPFIPQQLGDKLIIKSRKKKDPPPPKIVPYERLKERFDLDRAWLRVLGVSEDKLDDEIDKLYNWLINYIEMN